MPGSGGWFRRRICGGAAASARSLAIAAGVCLLLPALGAQTAAADPPGQITEFSAGLNAGSLPGGVAPGPDGNLWFTDFPFGATRAIGRITPSGTITEFSTGLNPGSRPFRIALGPDGNLWFTDNGATSAIGRITPSGTITEFSAGLNPGSSPYAIALGTDGNLWFNDDGATEAIGRITPSGTISEFSSGLNTDSRPYTIAPGADGNLWFTDHGATSAIGRITPSGTITEFSSGLNAGSSPLSIAPGADGNLWFTDRGTTEAIGRITLSGTITEFSTGLNAGSALTWIAPGPDGNLWFTDRGTTEAIGRITPSGTISEFSSGLNAGSDPDGIAPGADGNLWFTDEGTTRAIGRFGAGAPAAVQAPPSLSGAGQAGGPESCGPHFATWAGVTASTGLYSFDGYRWLRDGTAIAGASAQSYTPTSADIGHQLACELTATYPLPFFVSASAQSAAITVKAAGLSALHASAVRKAGRRVNGRCDAITAANRNDPHCTRTTALKIMYTLDSAASVKFTIQRTAPGRLVNGHCQAPTLKNRHDRRCTRIVASAALTRTGKAGVDTLKLATRIGHLQLTPGSYVLLATTTASGRTGSPRRTTFKITP